VETFDELCRARDELVDQQLQSRPGEDFRRKLARYLVFFEYLDEMPAQLVRAQEAVMAALEAPPTPT
jgi:hypothetical protein